MFDAEYKAEVEHRIRNDRGLTVRELIEILSTLNGNANVSCSTAADCSSTGIYGVRDYDGNNVMLQGW
jgi:hypothetical protein